MRHTTFVKIYARNSILTPSLRTVQLQNPAETEISSLITFSNDKLPIALHEKLVTACHH